LALEIAPSGDIAVEVYRRLGDLFIARAEIERAEEYLSKALDIGNHLNDRYELGSIYRAFGMLYAQKGNIDRARSFFMESAVTLQVIKERYELARTYITAADTYKEWCRTNNLPDEYKNDILRDADTYEVEAMHLYQSLGLDRKVKEVEALRRGSEKNLTQKDRARFIQLSVDNSWLYRASIVARSSHMREVIRKVERLAPGTIPVLVTGETGTGKEIFARLLHRLSGRSSGPFIPVNCASIADTVFESELFGHKRGAFTGAISDRIGLIERASGGTLFLDEISELTDHQQAKLLRTLEEKSIRRVGETKERPVDVRVASATNEDIGGLLNTGKLRTDFFFRISVERIDLAPLRERREDVMPLFTFYIQTLCGECEIENDIPMLLERYHWPGNVREVINIAKALAQLRRSDRVIRTSDLPLRIRDSSASELKTGTERFTDRIEMRKLLSADSCRKNRDQIRELIVSSLERCNGNYSAAARELGIGRTTLYRRMQELDLL
jgi:transcriptional regulator with PAS, ATPase and Fis domain